MTNGEPRNRLVLEKSPYLLQHADNPVDWYPWGAEAFEKAKQENKPVFLSIGYSTCHWCHVMAHESFEDSTVARLMNDVFVSVKVDREERPDIDMIYMTICQMMTGSGGWPLTIIMTPDKHPFFAGTYIPKETRFGRIGLVDLIPRVKELWTTRQAEVINSASQTTSALQQTSLSAPGAEPGESMLHRAYEELGDRFDGQWGGFGASPKFPMAHNLLFLLRYWKRTGNKKALSMVEKTLQMISRGGIFDHIGFGFHRYSTDQRWLVPHFEKMLYDQASLAMAYIETYQVTGNEEYARTAHNIFTYVLRDMTAVGGGFYSAEDADSEGEEGKYYLWTYEEIKHILTPDEADLFAKVFNIREDGNFTGEAMVGNIPHITRSLEEIASELGGTVPELQKRLESIRQKLFKYREQRVHPRKDDKILTDWNGLMVAALAKGARVLDEPGYARTAKRAAEFILDNMLDSDGRLFHRHRDGEAAIPAYLDDYAFLIYGLLELYETTFESYYLEKTMELNQYLMEHFWDDKNGGFYFTSDDSEAILTRQKEIYDGAIPSGNSIAMLNLLRLARITADSALEQKAAQIGRSFFERVRQSPSAYTQLMTAIDFAAGPSYELVIAGDPASDDTRAMLRAIDTRFIPNIILILVPPEPGSGDIERLLPFIRQMTDIEGKATAYVCHNYSCNLPTTDVDTMLRLLETSQHTLPE